MIHLCTRPVEEWVTGSLGVVLSERYNDASRCNILQMKKKTLKPEPGVPCVRSKWLNDHNTNTHHGGGHHQLVLVSQRPHRAQLVAQVTPIVASLRVVVDEELERHDA